MLTLPAESQVLALLGCLEGGGGTTVLSWPGRYPSPVLGGAGYPSVVLASVCVPQDRGAPPLGGGTPMQGRNEGCSCSCLRDVTIEINLGSTIVLMSITSTTNISLTSFFSLTNTFMTRSSSSLIFYIFGHFSMTRKASTKQMFRWAFSHRKKCFTVIQARSSKRGSLPSCFFSTRSKYEKLYFMSIF